MSELSSSVPAAEATYSYPNHLTDSGLRTRDSGLKSHLRRHIYPIMLPVVIASDALIIASTFLLFYGVRFHWGWLHPATPPAFLPYLHGSILIAIVWTGCMAFMGLYQEKRGASKFDDAMLMAAGITLGALITLSLSFFYRSFSYSRLVYAYAFFGSLVALGGWHVLLRMVQEWGMTRGWGSLTTLVLGCNNLSAQLTARLVARPQLGHQVVGVVALADEDGQTPHVAPVLGRESDLPSLLEAHAIDEVVVAWPTGSAQQVFGLVQAVTLMRPVTCQVAPGMQEMMTAHLELKSLDGLPMLAIREVALRKWQNRAIKRAMDIALSGAALLALMPVMAAIALTVKATSRGPIFYAQERLGRDGHTFTIYKFRSMTLEAEPDGPVWTRRDDDRATPIGAVLRRYSLDELPQLWNVLKGDMTLVGPRPERPYFVDQFRASVPRYMDRHLVRSGLTGWAQVNGLRGDVAIEDRTRYDIYYVENWSVLLDLRIMLKTVVEIFRRPGY